MLTDRSDRIEFLDQYRGLTILVMITVNLLAPFTIVPAWLKHATQIGQITITDFVIPSFMFAMGVAFELALPRSRNKNGTGRTIWRFVRRNVLLIGFGVLGSVILSRDLLGEWGVLQTLGGAGLVALPFMFLRPRYRPIIAVALIAAYEVIGVLGHWEWLKVHDTGHLGGVPGALAWGGFVLLSSYVGSFIAARDETNFRRSSVTMAVITIGLALLLRRWVPIFKPLVTATYLLATLGMAAIGLLLFALLKIRFRPFEVMGTNSLVIFMWHGILIETAPRIMPADSPLWLLAVYAVAVYGLCFLLAGFLYWKHIHIRL